MTWEQGTNLLLFASELAARTPSGWYATPFILAYQQVSRCECVVGPHLYGKSIPTRIIQVFPSPGDLG